MILVEGRRGLHETLCAMNWVMAQMRTLLVGFQFLVKMISFFLYFLFPRFCFFFLIISSHFHTSFISLSSTTFSINFITNHLSSGCYQNSVIFLLFFSSIFPLIFKVMFGSRKILRKEKK